MTRLTSSPHARPPRRHARGWAVRSVRCDFGPRNVPPVLPALARTLVVEPSTTPGWSSTSCTDDVVSTATLNSRSPTAPTAPTARRMPASPRASARDSAREQSARSRRAKFVDHRKRLRYDRAADAAPSLIARCFRSCRLSSLSRGRSRRSRTAEDRRVSRLEVASALG